MSTLMCFMGDRVQGRVCGVKEKVLGSEFRVLKRQHLIPNTPTLLADILPLV